MDSTAQGRVFNLLHPEVQSLIRSTLGWRQLREVQIRAIPPVLAADRDTLIIAGTASGKTEAAWLPILSRLLADGTPGVGALCVSPTKALIDDQVRRLAQYGQHLQLDVRAWHGDVNASRKEKTLRVPPAVLVITPESLQGLLLRKPREAELLLAPLRFAVIDEIHAFAGTERGHQLQALLHVIETRLRRRVPRVALSATVSDPPLMGQFLRPDAGSEVVVIQAPTTGSGIDVRVHGLYTSPSRVDPQHDDSDNELAVSEVAGGDRLRIARHIDMGTRGRRALVFARGRRQVEELTALLRDPTVTGSQRPDRFLAHHGSLATELRQAAETALRDRLDAVVVCTTTLELGVDLPDLDQVIQVDTCQSVASLRQRLGRSGRRDGTRPTLRVYAAEHPESKAKSMCSRLRVDLVQNIATIELIVTQNWVEPPDLAAVDHSTLIQQTLALLGSSPGAGAQSLWRVLCQTGPWHGVDQAAYAQLLRGLATHHLIREESPGRLTLDEAGHQLVNRRDFLAAFSASAEYTVRHNGRLLGTLTAGSGLRVGSALVLGGHTWQVVNVHERGWTIDVKPHACGLAPRFLSERASIHRVVRQTMRRVYESTEVPEYLDETAAVLLDEARREYRRLGLGQRSIIPVDGRCLIALWTGDRELATVERWMDTIRPGHDPEQNPIGLIVKASVSEANGLVRRLLEEDPPSAADLARGILLKESAKHDRYLPEQLLIADCASRRIDVPSARMALAELSSDTPLENVMGRSE